ncbi:MAG: hypothetical protein HYY10_00900 [Candidatus Liptonbacteria bacterium]|nr:hypothetical protein [Candidatus Liptonbacteria bacterium]
MRGRFVFTFPRASGSLFSRCSIKEVFRYLPPPARVLDLACGLNPLARPWMGIPDDAEYLACDALSDLTDFLGEVFAARGGLVPRGELGRAREGDARELCRALS